MLCGIFTGNYENISQMQTAVQKGGIIDGMSDTIDYVLEKTEEKGVLPTTIARTIRTGKNTLLNNVANNIENEFNQQIKSAERLQRYSSNWKECFNNKDFEGMTNQIYKIRTELKELVPMENTLKEARTIENLHNLIKNNGKDFNLSTEQQKLAKMLI